MAYFKPHIDESGIHIPFYTDIRDDLVQAAKGIFGEDIYLEPDSQDYQMICAFAEKVSDINELAVLTYNNRSPATAVGIGLDGVVKLNGVSRKADTHSICPVVLSGIPGTKIHQGIVGSGDETQWDIGDVVIPETGKIEVMATCRQSGPVYADAGTITKIVTQQRGWLSVHNVVNATPGRSVEIDAELRARQAVSTANPSVTISAGILGGVAALPEVTRYRMYENDTNTPDVNGIPGHCISLVVEGGKDEKIAQIIYLRKTPGSGTYGNVKVTVQPALDEEDIPAPIRFFRPQYVDVFVQIRVRPLAGFVTQTAADIRENICTYLNSIRIGENLTVSALYVPAMTATPNISAPCFSIQELLIGTQGGELSTEDLQVAFNQVTRGRLDYITVEIG